MSAEIQLLTEPIALSVRRELRRDAPSVRLAADQLREGELKVRLHWAPRRNGAGWLPTDVHLGCLWQLTDGGNGAMQSLGAAGPVPPSGAPLLALDPRTEQDGETIRIGLPRLLLLKRTVFYVYARSGLPDWSLQPTLTFTLPTGANVVVGLGTPPASGTICAIASLHRVGETVVLRRENEYLRGQQSAVTAAYGFDIGWADSAS